MYADRKKGLNPAALGGALLINGGMIAMLATLGAITVMPRGPESIETYPVRADPPPPAPPPEPKPVERRVETVQPAPRPDIVIPRPIIDPVPAGPVLTGTDAVPPGPPQPVPGGLGSGGVGTATLPPPAPVLVDAALDPRFASGFQPPYPGRELGLGREGRAVVRVLIGVDGRIKAVERIDADSDGFFEATRRHALARWRFTPATRDGVPVESWKRLTVRFTID